MIQKNDLQGAERLLAQAVRIQQGQRPPIELQSAEQLFVPLEPIPWVCQALELAPGAPTLIAGYGYSGKTLICQDLLLRVAAGQPIWGQHDVLQGRAVHIDYEMGARLLRERYQRLARGGDIKADDVAGRLDWCCFPRIYLDQRAAEDHLSDLLEDATLCLLDSLKAAAPSVDENSADARRTLDMLTRVSERTGCSVIVIHHSRKPSREALGGVRMAIRGSGALYDACQSVLVLEGQKGEPVIVHHEKARVSGVPASDVALRFTDVSHDCDMRWGLRIELDDIESIEQTANDARLDALADRVLAFIRDNPGCSTREVRQSVRGDSSSIGAALDRLLRYGALRNLGTDRRSEWRVTTHGGEA
jgi:hypothetical protein